VAGLIARLAQIKQQREVLDKEEAEILARLRDAIPKEHQALEAAEKLVKEHEGAATEKGGTRKTRGGNADQDSTALFNRYAQGQEHILISQVRNPADPQLAFRMTQFAQREGITSGRLSREQFAKFMREDMKRRPGGQGEKPGGVPGSNPGGQGGAPGAPSTPNRGQQRNPGQQ
jgi:hypothetical protein